MCNAYIHICTSVQRIILIRTYRVNSPRYTAYVCMCARTPSVFPGQNPIEHKRKYPIRFQSRFNARSNSGFTDRSIEWGWTGRVKHCPLNTM